MMKKGRKRRSISLRKKERKGRSIRFRNKEWVEKYIV